MTHYKFTPACARDYERLQKKYRSLPEDVERFCAFTRKLEAEKGFPAMNKNYALLKSTSAVSIYKARLACASLPGNKMRVVYARHKETIEFIMIELYVKNEKERENKERIAEYLSS